MLNLKEIQIIPAHNGHFQSVAGLHASGITEGFLSTMGIHFLTVLYRGIARAEGSGVLVALEQDRVLGFIAYARDIKTCYRQVLMSGWPALTFAMVPNAFNPSIYRKVIETLLYPFKQHDSSPESAVPGAELLSMAVDENARGKGIGRLLIAALDKEMSSMNIDGYNVVTHGIDGRSNAFYLSCGFIKVSEFIHHGKPMRKYWRKV